MWEALKELGGVYVNFAQGHAKWVKSHAGTTVGIVMIGVAVVVSGLAIRGLFA